MHKPGDLKSSPRRLFARREAFCLGYSLLPRPSAHAADRRLWFLWRTTRVSYTYISLPFPLAFGNTSETVAWVVRDHVSLLEVLRCEHAVYPTCLLPSPPFPRGERLPTIVPALSPLQCALASYSLVRRFPIPPGSESVPLMVDSKSSFVAAFDPG